MKDHAESQHLVFVVQKHTATTLHYDFRLEIGGRLIGANFGSIPLRVLCGRLIREG